MSKIEKLVSWNLLLRNLQGAILDFIGALSKTTAIKK
jgi:hypothetical protein